MENHFLYPWKIPQMTLATLALAMSVGTTLDSFQTFSEPGQWFSGSLQRCAAWRVNLLNPK